MTGSATAAISKGEGVEGLHVGRSVRAAKGPLPPTRYRPLKEEHSVDREGWLPVNAATG